MFLVIDTVIQLTARYQEQGHRIPSSITGQRGEFLVRGITELYRQSLHSHKRIGPGRNIGPCTARVLRRACRDDMGRLTSVHMGLAWYCVRSGRLLGTVILSGETRNKL